MQTKTFFLLILLFNISTAQAQGEPYLGGFGGGSSKQIILDSPLNSSTLPVTLTYFSGVTQNNNVVLNWTTASELNNSHFEVLHSTSGIQFSNIGYVTGQGTTSRTTQYNFTHLNPSLSNNFYQLKQVDFDGNFEYFGPILVNLSNTINHVKVYPNPFQDIINIEFQKDENLGPIFFKVIDNAGRIVFQQLLTENQNHFTRLYLKHLKPGVYILQIEGSTLNYNTKIVK